MISARTIALVVGVALSVIGGDVEAQSPMPAGHPEVPADEDGADAEAAPHAGQGAAEAMLRQPEDTANEDPSLPKGTVAIQILDVANRPVPRTDVTLGIVYNSVAKGESRKRLMQTTDDSGVARWADLDVGVGVAYRPMVLVEGATFSAPPFQLPLKAGIRATLHVFPIEREIDKTLVVTQSILYAEVKDDRVQVQQALKLYNFGKTAWVPTDLVVKLPADFTAFSAQQGMTDVGVDAVPKKGVRLRGTFTPGQHVVEFRWQLPYAGEADVVFDVGMTPHTAASRVIAPASRQMGLDVEGFPPPQQTTDGMGQRALVTERQLRRDEKPLTTTRVHISGLPTEGPAKYLVTMLAACVVAIGVVVGAKKPVRPDGAASRRILLADLESLERAKTTGDVGPKTYERTRRDLLDAIARTFAVDPRPPRKKKSA
jgi:hypothetical protein